MKRSQYLWICVAMMMIFSCTRDSEQRQATLKQSRNGVHEALSSAQRSAKSEIAEQKVIFTERSFSPGKSGARLGPEGGTIVAGDCRLSVPEGAIKEPHPIQFACHQAGKPQAMYPSGVVLAKGSSTPANLGLERVATLYIPLERLPPEGAEDVELELLGWHEHLDTWLTVSHGSVTSDGVTAKFYTDYLGDFVVRARPEQQRRKSSRCPAEDLTMHEEVPGREQDVVGLVETDERLSRSEAFAVLTDARTLSLQSHTIFKNEEHLGRHYRGKDGHNHQAEDYLMDPALAESLEHMGRLVASEWTMPWSGEPAYRVRVTEAYDSMEEHRDVSTHYQGRGMDLTLDPLPRGLMGTRRKVYGRLARLAVCAGFDYVFFENRFHIHVASSPSRIALLTIEPKQSFTVWVFSFSIPGKVTKLYHGEGDPPAWISWPKEQQIQLVSDKQRVVGHVDMQGGLHVVSGKQEAIKPTRVVGNRTVRIVDGHAYLIYANGNYSPGSDNTEGQELHYEAPFEIRLRSASEQVVAYAFMASGAE